MNVLVTTYQHGVIQDEYMVEAASLEDAADGLGECCVTDMETGEFLRF